LRDDKNSGHQTVKMFFRVNRSTPVLIVGFEATLHSSYTLFFTVNSTDVVRNLCAVLRSPDRVRYLERTLEMARESARRALAMAAWGGSRREADVCSARDES